MRRGDICYGHDNESNKVRPWLILTRDEAISVLRTILVAPLTTKIRHLQSEVILEPRLGLRQESVINIDNIRRIEPYLLDDPPLARVTPEEMHMICRALRKAIDC